jgi:uncharacterized membrane protein HdeD (DUF308 family)
MEKYWKPGVVAGVFALAGTVSVALGKPALGAVLADPATAATATTVASGIVALVAGILDGIRKDA